jgi:hypothetical protein
VGKITIGIGAALTVLGLAAFGMTLAKTALIPVAPGLPLCVLGYVALRNDKARMHVMHAAVLVSLIGFLAACVPLGMTVRNAVNTGEFRRADGSDPTFAVVVQVLMALLCAAHVALSVKSFIDARRNRKQAASATGGQVPT